ncbi:sugar ABC transporter substrate-binding protein [Peptostreptococcus russellii]|uniref:sugar ABC transporter substrate-binding protein n=1 Tax=Peptostreptococcus russellii TaxID=215200 RepID=UPI001A9BB2A8|nr:sugar ABC transporter substrate-binding protein [Peptostreptococcus russellii]
MKIKKLLSVCLAGVLAASFALTGCTDKKEKAATDDNVTLKMLVPGYDGGYLKKELDNGIKAFEEKNPNIKVQIVSVGWEDLNSKIIQLFQAKESPDIMLTGSRTLKQLVDMGAAENLSPFMKDDFKSKRVENVLKTAQIDGKQYGIPMAFSSRALYYRTDLIQNPPKNWDELLQTAKEVHAKDPKVYGFAIPTDLESGTDEILNFIYQNGGRIVDKDGKYTLNSKENVEALTYLKKFSDEGLIPDPVSMKRNDQATLFKNGNLAMFVSGPWEKEEMDKSEYKYGVAELPVGKFSAETLVTDSYVMSSQSKHKEAAWKFIEFMGQPEYQRPVSEAFGWFPVLKDEEKDKRFNDEFMKPFAAKIKDGVPEPQVSNWDTFNKTFVTAVQKVLTGKATPQEALDQAQSELEKQ